MSGREAMAELQYAQLIRMVKCELKTLSVNMRLSDGNLEVWARQVWKWQPDLITSAMYGVI